MLRKIWEKWQVVGHFMGNIVNTPANALHTFSYSSIDELVMGNFLVRKPEGYQESRPIRKMLLD